MNRATLRIRQSGFAREGESMKKYLAALLMGAALVAVLVTTAFGGQPTDPGCFGQDRAAWIHANGGSTWGAIAADRAGTNGDLNQAYKTTCGGDPTP